MAGFAQRQLSTLTDNLKHDLKSASKRQTVEGVHRIRVSIRRFRQALKVFQKHVPRAPAVKASV